MENGSQETVLTILSLLLLRTQRTEGTIGERLLQIRTLTKMYSDRQWHPARKTVTITQAHKKTQQFETRQGKRKVQTWQTCTVNEGDAQQFSNYHQPGTHTQSRIPGSNAKTIFHFL